MRLTLSLMGMWSFVGEVSDVDGDGGGHYGDHCCYGYDSLFGITWYRLI